MPPSDARTRRAGRFIALFAVCGLVIALTAVPAQASTETFFYTGGEQTFVVPTGVHALGLSVSGGRGGAGTSAGGGLAADLAATLTVTPGKTLYVEVGGNGQAGGPSGGAGGFNGGGDGSLGGGGGGGASDVRIAPRSAGLSPDTRLIVAGGGGGGGGSAATLGGIGGDAGEAGEEGAENSGNLGGGAGTTSIGGTGGFGCSETGANGELALGGQGGSGESSNGGGGGGGGRWGGGGGGGGCTDGGGGGGGGSSYSPSLSLVAKTPAPAEVAIAYTPPPAIAIESPSAGATYMQGQAVTAAYVCAANEGVPLSSCAGPVANGAPVDTATPGVHSFTVNAEDAKLGQSSKTVTYTVRSPSLAVVSAPDTRLGSHPKELINTGKKKVKVRFAFSSEPPGATFECRLDRGSFAPCASPKVYRAKLGKHVFSVEAVLGGVVDPTPTTFRFKVRRRG
jgi:hypothetical protein